MRKANFIKNKFYITNYLSKDKTEKSGVISITSIEYGDDTSETFEMFNPIQNGKADEKWKKALENKISN